MTYYIGENDIHTVDGAYAHLCQCGKLNGTDLSCASLLFEEIRTMAPPPRPHEVSPDYCEECDGRLTPGIDIADVLGGKTDEMVCLRCLLHEWNAAIIAARAEVERLTKLVESAYDEGFNEGIYEHEKPISGGKMWQDSKSRERLEWPGGEE
jgi:hypothetical protein